MKYHIAGRFAPEIIADQIYIGRQENGRLEVAQIAWVDVLPGEGAAPTLTLGRDDVLDVSLRDLQNDSVSANATIAQLRERVKYLESLVGTVLPSALKKVDR